MSLSRQIKTVYPWLVKCIVLTGYCMLSTETLKLSLRDLGTNEGETGHVKGFPRSLHHRLAAVAVLLLLAATCGPSCAGTLSQNTRTCFSQYVQTVEQRNTQELSRGGSFLWVDTLVPAARQRAQQSLASGGVEVSALQSTEAGQEISCPNSLIHHWVGTVFVPGAKLDDVLHLLQDYNHHAQYYAPNVQQSRIEQRNGEHYRVFLRFRRTKIITAVIDTVNDIQYYRDSPTQAHSRSSAIRINEVDNPGQPDEQENPAGHDNGFLWGMETWWRMEQKDGGVYVQSEVVSLTRDIPTGLGWMIGPFVQSIPRESLTFTLAATRRAVLSEKQSAFLASAPAQ
jgi:hypothetical protein